MTETLSTLHNLAAVPAKRVQQDPDGLQKVVTGGSDFLSLREQGYLMVDKTALIPMLVTMRPYVGDHAQCLFVTTSSFWQKYAPCYD